MSRVQLALNVNDIDEAVESYPSPEPRPTKRQPGYRQLRHRRSAAEAGSDGGPQCPGSRSQRCAQPPRRRSRDAGRGGSGNRAPEWHRARDHGRRADDLLLRRPGQGLGRRPRRRDMGGLHGARQHAPAGPGGSPATMVQCCTTDAEALPEGGDHQLPCSPARLRVTSQIGEDWVRDTVLYSACSQSSLQKRLPRRCIGRYRFWHRRAESPRRRATSGPVRSSSRTPRGRRRASSPSS